MPWICIGVLATDMGNAGSLAVWDVEIVRVYLNVSRHADVDG
jgi:hypothetical protein